MSEPGAGEHSEAAPNEHARDGTSPSHGHGDHEHGDGAGHGHSHGRDPSDNDDGHAHPTGFRGFLHGLFVPHSHDASDSLDDALEASEAGVRALKISLVILLATTVLQLVVVAISGSVALLADTVHNFSDALTAVPLWVAFLLGRRAATRRYTYGLGRAEDVAGLVIVLVVALSAIIAAWQAIDRLVHPQPVENLWWVIAAGVIGFAGNEAVAVYRIRVGRRIGSAALVADGVHARTDGFTSLAVVVGALGVMAGFPLADPIVGLVISAAILVLLWGTVRSVGRRLLDGIEPDLLDRADQALRTTPGVLDVPQLQLRWVGHRLQGAATVTVASTGLAEASTIADDAHRRLEHALPHLDAMHLRPRAGSSPGERLPAATPTAR